VRAGVAEVNEGALVRADLERAKVNKSALMMAEVRHDTIRSARPVVFATA
jgi:hypothetical protein